MCVRGSSDTVVSAFGRVFGKALLAQLVDVRSSTFCLRACVCEAVFQVSFCGPYSPLPGSLPRLGVSVGLPASLLSDFMEKLQVEHRVRETGLEVTTQPSSLCCLSQLT